MLAPAFVDGLRWLGTKGLAFELGVNARLGGLGQLREAVEMMQRVYSRVAKDSKEAVTIIISQFLVLAIGFSLANCL
jgi:L-rhamnono-1,4-lactonase